MNFLKRRSKWDWIAISCYIFMVFVIVGEGFRPAVAQAGDVQWQIHWQFNVPAQHQHYLGCPHYPLRPVPCNYNCPGDTIGTGGPTSSNTNTHNHNHVHHVGFYGYHIHNGVRYPVEYEYRNYRGQLCKEFQLYCPFHRQTEWATACQNRSGFWFLQK